MHTYITYINVYINTHLFTCIRAYMHNYLKKKKSLQLVKFGFDCVNEEEEKGSDGGRRTESGGGGGGEGGREGGGERERDTDRQKRDRQRGEKTDEQTCGQTERYWKIVFQSIKTLGLPHS